MKILRLCLFAFLCAFGASAATVRFAWDANTEPDLAGYRLHSGPSSRVYTNVVDVGLVTTYTVTNMPYDVTLFFALTAYSAPGLESDLSNELSVNMPTPVPPVPPGALAAVSLGFGKAGVQFTYADAAAASFRVFTNNVFMRGAAKSTNQLTVIDLPGLVSSAPYLVQVSAVGTNGLESARSAALTVRIPASAILRRN